MHGRNIPLEHAKRLQRRSRENQETLAGQDMENNPQALSSLRSRFRFAAVSPCADRAVEVLQVQFGKVVSVSAQAESFKVRLNHRAVVFPECIQPPAQTCGDSQYRLSSFDMYSSIKPFSFPSLAKGKSLRFSSVFSSFDSYPGSSFVEDAFNPVSTHHLGLSQLKTFLSSLLAP